MANRVQIQLRAQTPELLQSLLRRMPLDIDCGGPRRDDAGAVVVTAFVFADEVEILRSVEGIEILEPVDVRSAAATAAEVGEGDRFEGGRIVPKGYGRKTNKDEQ